MIAGYGVGKIIGQGIVPAYIKPFYGKAAYIMSEYSRDIMFKNSQFAIVGSSQIKVSAINISKFAFNKR